MLIFPVILVHCLFSFSTSQTIIDDVDHLEKLIKDISHSRADHLQAISGLHYNLSDYDNFDVNIAIRSFAVSKVEVSMWNPIDGHLQVSSDMDIYRNDPIQVATSICHSMVFNVAPFDWTAKFRCLYSTLHTIRWRKVQVISNISMFYELIPYEETVMSLVFTYDKLIHRPQQVIFSLLNNDFMATADGNSDLGEQNNQSEDSVHFGTVDATACVLGSPTVHSILPALMTPNIQKVFVFSRTFDEGYQSTDDTTNDSDSKSGGNVGVTLDWNYFYASEVASLLDKQIEYIGLNEVWSEFQAWKQIHTTWSKSVTESNTFNCKPNESSNDNCVDDEDCHKGTTGETEYGVEDCSNLYMEQLRELEESANYFHICDTIQFQPEFTTAMFYDSNDPYWVEKMKSEFVQFAEYLSVWSLEKEIDEDKKDNFIYSTHRSTGFPNADLISISCSIVTASFSLNIKELFDWELTSVWMLNSYFGLQKERIEHDGKDIKGFFIHQHGSYNDIKEKTKNWSLIRIGKFKHHQDRHHDNKRFDDNNNIESVISSMNNRSDSSIIKRKRKHVTKDSIIIIISTSLRIFVDNLFGIQDQLRGLGYPHVYITAEWSPLVYDVMNKKAQSLPIVQAGDAEGIVLHIPISSFDLTLFGKYAIIYNSEQKWCDAVFGFGFPRYNSLFQENNMMIWTFNNETFNIFESYASVVDYRTGVTQNPSLSSNNSVDELETTSVHRHAMAEESSTPEYLTAADRIALVSYHYLDMRPIYMQIHINTTTHFPYYAYSFIHTFITLEEFFEEYEALSPYLLEVNFIQDEEHEQRDQHIFSVFYGACSDDRAQKTKNLQYWLHQDHYIHRNVSKHYTFYNLCGYMQHDYTRDYYLMRSRVVINLQSNIWSALETHRINYLLAMGKVIISEPGNDLLMRSKYNGCVIFVESLRELYDEMMHYLMNYDAWEKQKEIVKACYEQKIREDSFRETELAMNKTMKALEYWVNQQ